MSDFKEREELHARYPHFLFGTWAACAYCGEPSGCRDHVFPVAMLTTKDRKRHGVMKYGPTVLACSDCNTRLGAKFFDSFKERAGWMQKYLLSRSAKGPRWDEQDLNALRGKLHSFVTMEQAKKSLLLIRSEWFGSDSYFQNLIGLRAQPTLTNGNPSFLPYYYAFFRSTIESIESRRNSWTAGQGAIQNTVSR